MGRRAAAPPPSIRARLSPPRHGRIRKRYVALLALLLLIGLIGWNVIMLMSARRGPLVDYAPALIELSADYQPPGDNGWNELRTVLQRFDSLGTPNASDWPTDPTVVWQATRLDAVHLGAFEADRLRYELMYLEHIGQPGVLDALDALIAWPRFVRDGFQADVQGISQSWQPELRAARDLGAARVAAIRVGLETEGELAMRRAWSHALLLARALSYDATLLSYLSGVQVGAAACQELSLLLTEHAMTEEACRDMLAALERSALPAPAALPLRAEQLMQYDLIQRFFTDDGAGNGVLLVKALTEYARGGGISGSGALPQHPIYNLQGVLYEDRRQTVQRLDAFIDAAVEQAALSRSQRAQHPFDLDAMIDPTELRRQPFLFLMMPGLGRVTELRDELQLRIAGVRVLLAIEIYEAVHGDLPTSLADLVPDYLPELPIDPISEQGLGYRTQEPSETDARPFLLYSVGVDGIDNGGAEPPVESTLPSDYALGERARRNNFDYVLNRRRETPEPDG